MKISVIYQYYQGHDAPGHSLVYELTQFLATNGHDVTVISGETGYMRQTKSKRSWHRRIVRNETDGSVKIVRTFTYSNLHRSYLDRILSFLSFTLSCPLGLFSIEKPNIVLASSPPLFPMFSALLVCKLRSIPFVIEVRDLWPDTAVQLGIVKNKYLINVMAWMEKIIYNQSVKIIALTEGIRKNICDRGWPRDKVELITCGVDCERLYPDKIGAKIVRKKYGWENKKVLMYFGAIGEANNIPVILRSAEDLQKHENILFVLVGDGMKRHNIQQRISASGLRNVIVLPAVAKSEAGSFINAADICLVTLRDIPLFKGAIPTKLIDYMACGKPVLCGVGGEAQRILETAQAGVAFEPNSNKQLSNLIVDLINNENKRTVFGANGQAFIRSRFSARKMREHTEMVLLDIVRKDTRNSTIQTSRFDRKPV